MYSSCMNTTAIEEFGDSELRILLSELGVFNFTKNGVYRWDDVAVKVKRRLEIDTFFRLKVLDDLRDSSKRRIVVGSLVFYFLTVICIY